MNQPEVESFLKLQPQLKSAYDEVSLLSKKKPTDPLNTFKLKFINNILSRANDILGRYVPFPGEFTSFDEADMPNNSDVVFILSHYLTALEKLRCDNIMKEHGFPYHWYWVTDGEMSDKQTDPATIK
jgi:hypothetical protein